jgi:hypothetical protein
MESRTTPTPAVLAYMDSTIAAFTAGGLSVDLTHHVMHALGSRIFGFTQELYDEPADQEVPAAAAAQLAEAYPHIAAVAASRPHDEHSVVGTGCDDQFEFEFTLDLLLDGVERLHLQGWTHPLADTGPSPASFTRHGRGARTVPRVRYRRRAAAAASDP